MQSQKPYNIDVFVRESFGTFTRKKCAEMEIDNVIKLFYKIHIIKGLHLS